MTPVQNCGYLTNINLCKMVKPQQKAGKTNGKVFLENKT